MGLEHLPPAKQRQAKRIVHELIGVYVGMRLQDDRVGARLLGAALAEERDNPAAPLDERPALDAFWRWVVQPQKGFKLL